MNTPYYFMSYSREDTVKQRRIIRELRERGVEIWVDVENLTPGTPTWEREIERAIRESMGIIVLLSPESNNSEWVRREISFGEQHRKRIFPVLIEGDDNTSTPLRLASHQRVDLRTRFEAGLDELADALKNYINVKQEIEQQRPAAAKEIKIKQPADLKKWGLPALIGLVGVLIVGGVFAVINKPPLATPTPPPVTTEAPLVNPVITDTATVHPTTAADEPTGRIIFTCEIAGSEVCIINADGSGWRRLTDTTFASFNASLTPDGKTAVYLVNYGDYTEIHEMDVTSGKTKQLTDFKKSVGAPEVSPDNRYIVFHYHAGNLQLWLMNRDGSNPHEFYSVSGKDVHDGVWSPDGSQILFALGKGENNQLYIMNFSGGAPRLVNDKIDTRGRSDWSPLNLIAFDQGGPFAHEVFTMNLDGSGLTQITSGNNAQGVSFSPDGKWIAFTAYTNVAAKDLKSCEIFIMRTDGSDVRQLTDNNYCDYQPRWGN
ncbi:MAG: TIR domain-containing protein [Chloroflexota bacterium]|jgi:hypothetical protein